MNKQALSFIFSLLLAGILRGQTFQKQINIPVSVLHQFNGSSYNICSRFGTFNYGSLHLVNTDNLFNVVIEKQYSFPGLNGWADIKKTNDNGFIILGHTGNGTTNFGMAVLIKTDASYDTLWTRGLWVDSLHNITLTSIYQTADSGYVMFGDDYDHSGSPVKNMIAVRLDASGNIVLAKKILDPLGQSWSCFGNTTSDGNYIVTGTDNMIIKMNDMLNILWTTPFNANSGQYIAEGAYHDIYCLAGGSGSSSLTVDVHVIKTDSAGNLKWIKSYGTAYHDYASLRPTPDGGFILFGYYFGFNIQNYSRNYLLKADSSGNILWTRNFQPDTTSLSECHIGPLIPYASGYLFATSLAYSPWDGIRLIKTNSLGISGCHERNLVFTQYSPPTLFSPSSYSVTTFPLQPFYMPISVSDSSIFTITDICLTTDAEGLKTESEESISICPNPADEELSIRQSSSFEKKEMTIYNSFGQKILAKEFAAGEKEIKLNIKDFSPGVYTVRVNGEKIDRTKKFVKE